MDKAKIFSKIKNSLIVSCQALEGEPLYGSEIMAKLARAALEGGARGIRANTCEDILSIKKEVDLPIIGIIKKNYPNSDVYITPTIKEAEEVIKAGADVVAVDATRRPRPDGMTLEEYYKEIRKNFDTILMADISTYEEGIEAEKLGFDLIATTLSGYTPYSEKCKGPNYKLIRKLSKNLKVPLVAEGRVEAPIQALRCLRAGAFSIVVGGAITRPQLITQRFSLKIALADKDRQKINYSHII